MALWTPAAATSATLVAWWRAATISSLTKAGGGTPANGDLVSDWASLAGSFSASQATGGAQPTYSTTALNGNPALVFTGAQSLPFTLPTTLPGDSTFATMGQDNSGSTAYPMIVSVGRTAAVGQARYVFSDPGNNWAAGVSGAVSNTNVATTYGTATPRPVVWGLNFTTQDQFVRVDGNAAASATYGGTFVDPGNLGDIGVWRGFGQSWNGPISEIVIYSGLLSSGEQQQLEAYLAWQAGTQANLPSGHPYKSAAPTIASANVGAAAGTSTATGQGLLKQVGVGSSAGTGTAAGQGKMLSRGVGSSPGVGTAAGVGALKQSGAGASTGTGTASGAGNALQRGVGSAAGVGTASATSSSASSGSAAGISTATGQGITLQRGNGQADGTSTVAGTGRFLSVGNGLATGLGSAAAVGLSLQRGDGLAAGTSAASGASSSATTATGSSAGTSTATGQGNVLQRADGSASGTSTITGTGRLLAVGQGAAFGQGTAAAVGANLARGNGLAAGVGTASGLSFFVVLVPADRRVTLSERGSRVTSIAETGTRRVSA